MWTLSQSYNSKEGSRIDVDCAAAAHMKIIVSTCFCGLDAGRADGSVLFISRAVPTRCHLGALHCLTGLERLEMSELLKGLV